MTSGWTLRLPWDFTLRWSNVGPSTRTPHNKQSTLLSVPLVCGIMYCIYRDYDLGKQKYYNMTHGRNETVGKKKKNIRTNPNQPYVHVFKDTHTNITHTLTSVYYIIIKMTNIPWTQSILKDLGPYISCGINPPQSLYTQDLSLLSPFLLPNRTPRSLVFWHN